MPIPYGHLYSIEHLEGVVCSISAPRWDEIIRTGSVAEDNDKHSDNGGEYGDHDYDEGQDSATIIESVDEVGWSIMLWWKQFSQRRMVDCSASTLSSKHCFLQRFSLVDDPYSPWEEILVMLQGVPKNVI